MSEWWVKNGDAPNVWDDGLPPGGQACEACGQPTESEPCEEHQPYAFARQLLDVDGLLAELTESPLPGARYAYEVVKRRLSLKDADPDWVISAAVQPIFDEADDMCPNCITPWKCNGPHIVDETHVMRRCPATQQTETWGLMWCGLYADHPVVEGNHHWVAEVKP